MSVTPQQVELVKKTWVMVVPISDKAAELFYGRLFELEPEYRSMFKGDMMDQGKKLMKTINIAVESLDDVEPELGGQLERFDIDAFVVAVEAATELTGRHEGTQEPRAIGHGPHLPVDPRIGEADGHAGCEA